MTRRAIEAALRRADEIVLVTRGRRSGKPHRVSLWFAYDDGAVWLRTDRTTDWFRNLAREPRCAVVVEGTEVGARREPVPDADAALRRLVDLWRAKYGAEWVADWYVERGRIPVRLRLDATP
jgi:hypothetical protein